MALRPRFPGKPERKDEHRINDFIRVPVVRLVDANGQMAGEVPLDQAKRMAREAGLDLVEVAPEAKPPVCKILDYGKFKFEEKKSKKKKVKHHGSDLKEVRLRPRTGNHDFETKLKHAREFLEEGNKVLFTIFFRGREQAHKELGKARMDQIKRETEDIAKVEHELSMMGPRMHLTLMPKPGAKPKEPKPPKPADAKPGEPPKVADGQAAPPAASPPVATATPPPATAAPEAPSSAAPPGTVGTAKAAEGNPKTEPKENTNAEAKNK